jgi:hypothetical protein
LLEPGAEDCSSNRLLCDRTLCTASCICFIPSDVLPPSCFAQHCTSCPSCTKAAIQNNDRDHIDHDFNLQTEIGSLPVARWAEKKCNAECCAMLSWLLEYQEADEFPRTQDEHGNRASNRLGQAYLKVQTARA